MATKKNSKKAAPKKALAKKKPVAKKAPAKKKPAAKKPAPKKKPVAKKATPKKPVKKSTPKKAVKKAAPKKKVVAKKPATKKAVKKAATKKVVAKKPVKAVVKKAAPAKKVITKVVAKTKIAPKQPEKKVAVKAAPVKAAPAAKEVKAVETKPAKDITVNKRPPSRGRRRGMPEKQTKKSTFSQPNDIKAFAAMSKSFKIPLAKPNVVKTEFKGVADTRSRYSDAELMEFKEIINKKLIEARRDLEMLKGSLSHTDDHGTDDTSPTFKMMEDGSETLSREETAQLAGRQEKFIMALENALIRIENKTYGICRVTGKLIGKERLRLVPHTTLSIEAKNLQD